MILVKKELLGDEKNLETTGEKKSGPRIELAQFLYHSEEDYLVLVDPQ